MQDDIAALIKKYAISCRESRFCDSYSPKLCMRSRGYNGFDVVMYAIAA